MKGLFVVLLLTGWLVPIPFCIHSTTFAQDIPQKTLESIKQIERSLHKEVIWLNDHVIEIKDKLSGLRTRYNLHIKEVNPDSIDQVIDLTTIDTSQFSGMYSSWQTIPLGNSVGEPLVISDISQNGQVELSGSYKIELNTEPTKAAIFEMNTDSMFTLKKLFVDSIIGTIGGISTDLDYDSLKEITYLKLGGSGLKNKEAVALDSLPDSTNFETNLSIVAGSSRMGDFDNDGFIDYLAVLNDSEYVTTPYIAEYDPAVNNFVEVYRFYPHRRVFIYNFDVGDSDADGKIDFAGASIFGHVFVIENTGDNQYELIWSDSLSNSNADRSAATNDIDGNGKPEFFIGADGYYQGQYGTELFWFEAISDNQFQVVKRTFLIGTGWSSQNSLLHADVDGDGIEELIFHFESQVIILKADSQKEFSVYYLKVWPNPNQEITTVTVYTPDYQTYGDLLVSIRNTIQTPRRITYYYRYNSIINIGKSPIKQPLNFSLNPNYPNPFNSTTIIPFRVAKKTRISLIIYDITGKEVRPLISKQLYFPGNYEIIWDGKNQKGKEVSSGIYFYALKSHTFKQVRKLLIIN